MTPMGRNSISALPVFILLISLVSISCSSSRYQQGFSYQPTYAGPDVAAGQSDEKTTPETLQASNPTQINSLSPIPDAVIEPSAPQAVLAEIVTKEYQESQQGNNSLNNRELIHKMASDYAISQNKQLTNKQLRKLDHYADKMEKKQRRGVEDVNWGPANNLEWFILLGAGVALVVGILGIGFGWFIFLGLALVYLYLKLLKNN
jgi:hypothetical protein